MSEAKKDSVAEKKISRRSLLKRTGALAVAGAVGVGVGYEVNNLLKPVPPPATSSLVTNPENEVVYATRSNNGPHLTYVKNGRVIRSDTIPVPYAASYPKFQVGDKTFNPPLKSINGPVTMGYRKYTYATDRVQYPMKRVGFVPGGKGPVDNRGKGEFVRITWDEALDIVASEWKRVIQQYGPSAVAQYTGSNCEQTNLEGSTSHTRLLCLMGGYTTVRVPTYSSAGWCFGGPLIYGYNWAKGGCDATDLAWETVNNAKMIVFWAHNTMVTQMSSDGPNAANLYFFLKDLGKKMVVIDPRYNDTAAKYDMNWISIIPGTDCAMMAAIANVWITEGIYDKDYVATHTFGFDEQSLPKGAPANSSFTAYITGKMDGVPKTPEWAEKITGVKARVIRALAREWASQPTMLSAGTGPIAPSNGAQRGSYGYEVGRFQVALIAMQGFGKPGVNLWNGEGDWPLNKMAAPQPNINSVLSKSYPNPIKQYVNQHAFRRRDLESFDLVDWSRGDREF